MQWSKVKKTKRQKIIYKSLHRKLKIEQGLLVPAPLVTPVVLHEHRLIWK
jgi:hypothetical protein